MKYMRVFQTLLAFSGSAPPQLALTRELVERGHEVRVVAHSAARARLERTGAEFVAIRDWLPDLDITHPETDPIRDWEARTPLGAAKRMRDAPIAPLRAATRENVELLDEWSADVIVFDWQFIAAPIAAERAGIPAVALVHCPYPFPARGAPPLFSGQKPLGGPLGAARDGLLNAVTRRFTAAGLPMLNEVRSEHGLAPLKEWNDQILGVRAIYVMTAPELDFSSKAQLPANVHYVGPAFEPFEKEWESPWPSDNTDLAGADQLQHQLHEPAGSGPACPRRRGRSARPGAARRPGPRLTRVSSGSPTTHAACLSCPIEPFFHTRRSSSPTRAGKRSTPPSPTAFRWSAFPTVATSRITRSAWLRSTPE